MTETLTIQNFAGTRFLELEVRPITVLIGPQASGKSICAKLLFYFRDFHQYIADFIFSGKNIKLLAEGYCQVFEDYFPIHTWGNSAFEVNYRNAKGHIRIFHTSNHDQAVNLSYGQFYKDVIESLDQQYQAQVDQDYASDLEVSLGMSKKSQLVKQSLVNLIEDKLEAKVAIDQVFIPASRSFFSILQENIFSLLLGNQSFDPLMKRFGAFYERIKHVKDQFYKSSSGKQSIQTGQDDDSPVNEMKELIDEILSGEYVQENNLDFLIQANDRKIRVSNASSGQQETLPLVLVLAFLAALKPKNIRKKAIYIEEPEAHIFPLTQKKVIELIALVFNNLENKFEFFITTHSPYVLTALNNLMQAGDGYNEFGENPIKLENLKEIVSEFRALNPIQIAAYSLSDGECVSIIDPETQLIDGSMIDGVSDEIAVEFDSLLDLMET